jgi:DNA-binding CsgD family transcriptional regulator
MRLEPNRIQNKTRDTYNGYNGRPYNRGLCSGAYLPQVPCASESESLVDDPLLGILESLGCGGILRDALGRVIGINGAALRMLQQELGATHLDSVDRLSSAVDRLLNRASARLSADGKSWVTVRRECGRPLAIYPLRIVGPPERTILILVDVATCLEPRPLTLQRMFGLTAAEMKLASAIALGSAPTELARQWHLSRATVRSQLASIFCKTHTRRQAELVALLARISILP